VRDVSFHRTTAERFGRVAAALPPLVAALLLALDAMWWREHARSAPSAKRRPAEPRLSREFETAALCCDEDEHRTLHRAPAAAPPSTAPARTQARTDAGASSVAASASAAAGTAEGSTLFHLGSGLGVDLEAARRVASYDDLQIHTL
jgi:hypothetical protein